jgi:hypothetical protein
MTLKRKMLRVAVTLRRSLLRPSTPPLAVKFTARVLALLLLFLFAFISLLLLLTTFEVRAQPQGSATQQQDDAAPPPMRHIPDSVRKQLDDARDIKARTRLSLELADATITRAAEHVAAERFEQATGELGVYEAIVEDSIRFVQNSGKVTNKQRDLFKRIEMALRSHVPRLETIRRALPAAHAAYVKLTIEFVRDQRDRALNAFYDDTVIPDEPQPKNKPPASERATGASNAATAAEKKPEQHH